MPELNPAAQPANLTLLSIAQADGAETLGIKTEAGVIDVRRASQALGLPAPLTLDDMLREGSAAALTALTAAVAAAPVAAGVVIEETTVRHGRLFTHPGKIICVGLNYRRHAQEIGMPFPRQPVLFSKFNNALAAHGAVIALPPAGVATKFDYETELLVVIGRSARDVPEAEALAYVAGYCTANDLSARDLQLETGGQWLAGKTLEGFAPIGPYFVSADQIPDPNALALETTVNGEVRQSGHTSDFIFNCQQVIAYVSRLWTLEAGDLIFTGTPQGVIAGRPKDRQVWLHAGDRITSTVAGLGTLAFTLA